MVMLIPILVGEFGTVAKKSRRKNARGSNMKSENKEGKIEDRMLKKR